MATKNHNIRFNLIKEEEQKAWDKLHSKEVEQMFKSKNSFVLQAINYYYDRCIAISNDPYLETREREDAFVDRIADMVDQKVLCNIPALAGIYLMQQQAFVSASMQCGITTVMPQMQGSNHSSSGHDNLENNLDDSKRNITESGADVEDNELVDFDLF